MLRRTKPIHQQAVEPGESASGFFVSSGLSSDFPNTIATEARARASASRILVAGSPGLAVGELLTWVRMLGHPVDFADGAEEARHQLALVSYRFAFLVEGDMSGQTASLCRLARKTFGDGENCPRLIVISLKKPRLAAWRTRCHTYLTVPVNRGDLQQYLELFSILPKA